MGFSKFWIKHGPGSPGATAKAIAKDFMKWKGELPQASKSELLINTLLTRMTSYTMLGLQPLSEKEQEELLKQSEGKLRKLIRLIILHENPAALEVLMTDPRTMLEVIHEAVNKYAPGVE
jgi:hypothetical protein